MKRQLTTLSLAFLLIGTLTAQQEEVLSKREQIYAQKVGFLTSQVGLSASDAEKFWPVYNQRKQELEQARMSRRALRKKYRIGVDDISDEKLEELLDQEIQLKQKELDIRKVYHERFKALIGVKKTAKLYRAEVIFDTKLVRGVREKAKLRQRRP